MRANARLGRIGGRGRRRRGAVRRLVPEVWSARRPASTWPPPSTRSRRRSTCVCRTRRSHDPCETSARPTGREGRVPRAHRCRRSARSGCVRRAGSCSSCWRSRSATRGSRCGGSRSLAAPACVGGFVADLFAPRLPTDTREEAVVVACVSAAGDRRAARVRAVRAPAADGLRVRRGGRLGARAAGVPEPDAAQRARGGPRAGVRPLRGGVPAGVGAGAFIPALLPIDFRTGILVLALFYVTLGRGLHLAPPPTQGRPAASACRGLSSEPDASREGGQDGGVHDGRAGGRGRPRVRGGVRCRGSGDRRRARRGQLYAFSDICTHQGCNLSSGGEIGGHRDHVRMPREHVRHDTGAVLEGPATEPVATFPVREDNGQLQIEV